MTRKKRYLFSYLLLALALVVLFVANLFWGSVALTPGAVLAAVGRTHCRWASSPSCACPGP